MRKPTTESTLLQRIVTVGAVGLATIAVLSGLPGPASAIEMTGRPSVSDKHRDAFAIAGQNNALPGVQRLNPLNYQRLLNASSSIPRVPTLAKGHTARHAPVSPSDAILLSRG